ncbi:MAG: carboxypeptidase-like regulatory domain-containing protein, partial [Bacteroidota bacterium]
MKTPLLISLLVSLIAFTGQAQQLAKGYVIDQQKEPLIGVNIQIKGTNEGTITDLNGNFQLEVPDAESVLVVSYIGFATRELKVESGTMNIVLDMEASMVDEVVVAGFSGAIGQARRRAASVQKIPESVVTLTMLQLEVMGIVNIQSFAPLIPNVSFQSSQNVGVNFINVRGIAQIRNGEAPVAFVIDGVTIPDANLLNQALYDLAMIEVVKGPQGTLYGKNAIGGAINILTMAPTNYTKNKLSIGYGNGNSFQTRLSSSGPLLKDKIYYRLSGSYKKSDGVIENVTLNEPVDFLEDLSLRGQLKFDFSNRFSASLTGQFSNTEGGATYYAHSPTGLQLDANDFDNIIDADQRGESFLRNSFAALKLEYNLGKSIFRSVSSY